MIVCNHNFKNRSLILLEKFPNILKCYIQSSKCASAVKCTHIGHVPKSMGTAFRATSTNPGCVTQIRNRQKDISRYTQTQRMITKWSSQTYPERRIPDNIQETAGNSSLPSALNYILLKKERKKERKSLKLYMWEYDLLTTTTTKLLSVFLLDVWLYYLVKCHSFWYVVYIQ